MKNFLIIFTPILLFIILPFIGVFLVIAILITSYSAIFSSVDTKLDTLHVITVKDEILFEDYADFKQKSSIKTVLEKLKPEIENLNNDILIEQMQLLPPFVVENLAFYIFKNEAGDYNALPFDDYEGLNQDKTYLSILLYYQIFFLNYHEDNIANIINSELRSLYPTSSLTDKEKALHYEFWLDKFSQQKTEDKYKFYHYLSKKSLIAPYFENELKLTQNYGATSYPNYPLKNSLPFHNGVDIKSLTPNKGIYSIGNGEIVKINYGNSDYGNYILAKYYIQNKDNAQEFKEIWCLYAHLSEIYVSPSELIIQNQLIAKEGNTGNSTGSHLHFSFFTNPFMSYFDVLDPATQEDFWLSLNLLIKINEATN